MLVYFDEMVQLKSKRAGIIPYVKLNGQIYFLMGIDAQTGEYSDMGGGLKINETIISCAMRELIEETRELIQPDYLKQIKVGVYDKTNSNCIIFCELKNTKIYYTICENFNTSNKHGLEYDEMSGLIWLTRDEMIENIYGENSKMWSRIKYTLSNCGNFDDHLLMLLMNG